MLRTEDKVPKRRRRKGAKDTPATVYLKPQEGRKDDVEIRESLASLGVILLMLLTTASMFTYIYSSVFISGERHFKKSFKNDDGCSEHI